jgi:hypothetical protein
MVIRGQFGDNFNSRKLNIKQWWVTIWNLSKPKSKQKKNHYSSRVFTKNATVFPVPVLALARTSFPAEKGLLDCSHD